MTGLFVISISRLHQQVKTGYTVLQQVTKAFSLL